MKEIVAIIRPNKIGATKDALEALGFASFTAEAVTGRGKQRGIAGEVHYDFKPERLLSMARSAGMKYVPKRRLTIVVSDAEVDTVVKSIIEVNQTGQVGDGKIFVCSLEEAIRVRTDEKGDTAL